MSTPILATKLYLPPPRPDVIPRPRLIERLDQGLHRTLTLVCAPAGFGKTALIGAWVGGLAEPAAWLSLDAGDSDPARFLTYLIAAVRTVAPDVGAGVLSALASPQPPPPEPALTELLNEIAALPTRFILVLDDYHAINSRPVDHALTFLLEHLPPQIHLIIATREDPNLPLARLRARGHLTELRAADLRFTAPEAAAFLTQTMGLVLSAADVAALETRTEGWIAGLQLAALSMQGQRDASDFIRTFTGDHRYIVDYLVEEVLQRQPDDVRGFLLQTAILELLCGPLCDAVTGQAGGHARLASLERGNFFVVPLDDTRHWYRYHHLFADVLAAHLRAEQPDAVATLHRRASMWYERHGAAADAIHHALAGADYDRAADLVERAWPAMGRARQEVTLQRWLEALPDATIRARPVLGVVYAHVLLSNGVSEGVEEHLRDAEWWLDAADGRAWGHAPSGEMVIADDEGLRRLPGMIAIARAGLAMARGDLPETVAYARRALDLAPEDDHLTRGGAAGFLGLASWASGDLETAHRSHAAGMESLRKDGRVADTIGGAVAQADIRIAQGRLREAMRTYEDALARASEGGTVPRGTADMHVGLAELHRERNDLRAATQHLLMSEELGEHRGFPQHPYRRRVAMARIREAEGDWGAALALLDEAERRYMGDFHPNVRPIAALRARVWVALGKVGEAIDWARERGLAADDGLTYLREFEHITLARVLLARYQSDAADRSSVDEATGLLGRLLEAAKVGGRMGSTIEILVVQALVDHARGDVAAALAPLSRALLLAESEGYVRIFVDEGPPMAALLEHAAKCGIAPAYVPRLRAAFGITERSVPAGPALIEPLSGRERDVLRLLATELSGPEMAQALFVSLNTLRTHTKNIYTKLEASTRQAAVRRARELDLL